MTKEQDALEAKYRLILKLACLAALIVITIIDAVSQTFNAPVEVELALVAVIGGIEVREKVSRIRRTKPRRRR